MIAFTLLAMLAGAVLGTLGAVVIVPERERNGFEDYDLKENFRAAGGAATDGQGIGRRGDESGTAGVRSSTTNRE